MARVTVYMTLPDEALARGWNDDVAELEASVKARLDELVGDDGDAYHPHVLGVDVEDD